MIKRIVAAVQVGNLRVLLRSIGIQSAGYALALALTPFAIAFYKPEDFGHFAVVFFAASLFGTYGALRLEWAVINEHSGRMARLLVRFGLTLVFAWSVLLLIVALTVPNGIWKPFDVTGTDMLWAAPIAMAIGFGIFQQSYGVRTQAFDSVYFARNTVMVSRQIFQIGLGLLYPSLAALALAECLARALGIAVRIRRLGALRLLAPKGFYHLARGGFRRRYSHYTRVALPSSLINFTMTESISVLLLLLQGPTIAGAYWLVIRILGLPVSLIGTVVGDVFQGQMAREKNKTVFLRYMQRTGLLLSIFSLVTLPTTAVLFYFFTAYFYDGRWALSGTISLVLIPAICIQFVASPLSRSLILLQKMEYKYFFDATLFVGIVTWVLITWLAELDILLSISLLSAVQAVAYLVYLALSFVVVSKVSGRIDERQS